MNLSAVKMLLFNRVSVISYRHKGTFKYFTAVMFHVVIFCLVPLLTTSILERHTVSIFCPVVEVRVFLHDTGKQLLDCMV